jgi:hypothetical protein
MCDRSKNSHFKWTKKWGADQQDGDASQDASQLSYTGIEWLAGKSVVQSDEFWSHGIALVPFSVW